jgi:transcriptional regulator with XRE-family HTH domain
MESPTSGTFRVRSHRLLTWMALDVDSTGVEGTGVVSTGGAGIDRQRFSRFVRRAVDEAKDRRGWTVTRLSAETGVGRSTLFRWLAGDYQQFPELSRVHNFCAALDIPVSAAFGALGVPADATAATAATVTDVGADVRDDIDRILWRLAHPRTPQSEKDVIRDMLRYLARRAAASPVVRRAAAA